MIIFCSLGLLAVCVLKKFVFNLTVVKPLLCAGSGSERFAHHSSFNPPSSQEAGTVLISISKTR